MAGLPINHGAVTRRAILREVCDANRDDRVAALAPRQNPHPESAKPKSSAGWLLALLIGLLPPLLGFSAYSLFPERTAERPIAPPRASIIDASIQALLVSNAWSQLAQTDHADPLNHAAPDDANVEEFVTWGIKNGESPSHDYLSLLNDTEVSLADLFGLDVKTIVIDPGHGGRDPGAVGPGGLREKDVTLDLAKRLRDRLTRHGYRILMTREDDVTKSLRERVAFANAYGADLFISLHINALPVEDPTIVETYYFGPQSDEQALRVAQRENAESEYVMADFPEMISKIGESFRQQESKKLAAAIQHSLYRNIKRENRKLVSWGIKTAPFVILLGADMPSVLAEVTTLSNRHEEQKLTTAEYRGNIARYLEEGIARYLEKLHLQEGPFIGAKRNGSKITEKS